MVCAIKQRCSVHSVQVFIRVSVTHSLDFAQVVKAVRPAAQNVLAHGQVGLLVAAGFLSLGKQVLGF